MTFRQGFLVPLSHSHYPEEPFFQGFDTASAFAFYESVRGRLPNANFSTDMRQTSGLLEIADDFDTFCFDAFGVLNVGTTPIPGAVETVAALRKMGKRLFIITNGATFTKPAALEKFEKLGFDFGADEIITSRMAAEEALADRDDLMWGVMSREDFRPSDLSVPSTLLGNTSDSYDNVDGFLLLSTWDWSSHMQILLETSLSKNTRPVVVANPDVIAPLETSFSTESGFCAHRLADLLGANIEFHGKPFPSVFELVERRLPEDVERKRICMIGDTLHTDVWGGAQAGWSTVLVSNHGLFRGHDPLPFIEESGIVPDWIVPTI